MKQVDTWNASYFITQSIGILTSAMPKLLCVKCQVDINNQSAIIKMYQKLAVMQWKTNLATSPAWKVLQFWYKLLKLRDDRYTTPIVHSKL